MGQVRIDCLKARFNSAFRNLKSAILLGAMLFALCFPVWAQQPKKIPRLGFLTASISTDNSARHDAFRQGLRELGYVEGKNIVVEWRFAAGKQDRQRAMAAELARLKVDVIVAVGTGDIRAAKEASATIPIVMVSGGDAVGSGLVASLARPGGKHHRIGNPPPRTKWKTNRTSDGDHSQALPCRRLREFK